VFGSDIIFKPVEAEEVGGEIEVDVEIEVMDRTRINRERKENIFCLQFKTNE
jgi:hypothetical protein